MSRFPTKFVASSFETVDIVDKSWTERLRWMVWRSGVDDKGWLMNVAVGRAGFRDEALPSGYCVLSFLLSVILSAWIVEETISPLTAFPPMPLFPRLLFLLSLRSFYRQIWILCSLCYWKTKDEEEPQWIGCIHSLTTLNNQNPCARARRPDR